MLDFSFIICKGCHNGQADTKAQQQCLILSQTLGGSLCMPIY